MNLKLTATLHNRFKPMFPSLINFHCDDGWFDILRNTFVDMERVCISRKAPHPSIVQVKEKFGELRIYFRCQTEESELNRLLHECTHEALRASCSTCECCGAIPARSCILEDKGNRQKSLCEKCEVNANAQGLEHSVYVNMRLPRNISEEKH
ncbi:MAG: hypothetical protein GX780_06375 [Campylobacteraceae bacterium]|nr:hypothetical protein [Campylobacteraceae bacterium]